MSPYSKVMKGGRWINHKIVSTQNMRFDRTSIGFSSHGNSISSISIGSRRVIELVVVVEEAEAAVVVVVVE